MQSWTETVRYTVPYSSYNHTHRQHSTPSWPSHQGFVSPGPYPVFPSPLRSHSLSLWRGPSLVAAITVPLAMMGDRGAE